MLAIRRALSCVILFVVCGCGPRDPSDLLRDTKIDIHRLRMEQAAARWLPALQDQTSAILLNDPNVASVQLAMEYQGCEPIGRPRQWIGFHAVLELAPTDQKDDKRLENILRRAFAIAGYPQAVFRQLGQVNGEYYAEGSMISSGEPTSQPATTQPGQPDGAPASQPAMRHDNYEAGHAKTA